MQLHAGYKLRSVEKILNNDDSFSAQKELLNSLSTFECEINEKKIPNRAVVDPSMEDEIAVTIFCDKTN